MWNVLKNNRTSLSVVVMLFLLASVSCGGSSSSSPGSSDSNISQVSFESQSLVIQKMLGGELTLSVEVADTDERRSQGLMYRKTLDADKGMLFLFSQESRLSFWMKNTYVSLDIVFINSKNKIVHIEENTTPLSLESVTTSTDAQYVLEVNGGYTTTNGVNVGDQVSF